MTKKAIQTKKTKGSQNDEKSFFVQSNIDDLINQLNEEKEELDESEKEESAENQDLKEENLEETLDLETKTDLDEKKEEKEDSAEIAENNDKNLEIEDKDLKPLNHQEQKELKEQLTNELKSNEIIIEEDISQTIEEQRKKLDEAEQSVSKRNSKKSKKLNLIFFILNMLIVAGILIYQLTKEDYAPIEGLSLNISYLLVILIFFGLVIFFDTSAIGYLLKQSSGKCKFGMAYKVAEIGRYYDCVTPMATGGQPFQMSYLKSHGMPLHTSLSIPLAKYVFHQMSWVLISFVCLIISFTDPNFSTFVSVTSVLGFVLGAIILFVIVFLSVCKSLGRKLVAKSLKLLQKMKLIKNYDKTYEKIIKYISDYQDVMKQYARSPKDFTVMLTISLLRMIANYSIPFFVVKLFMPGLDNSMYLNMFVMSMLVDLSSSFFPLPGGTGMNEISFTAAFASVIGEGNILVWVLLVWRFFSYYVYLLQGICIISYDMAYGNRKYKWEVVKEKLEEESAVFKQNQIDKFRADRAKRRRKKQKNDKNKEYL